MQISSMANIAIGDFTLEAWIRDEANPLVSSFETVFSYAPNTFNTSVLYLYITDGHPALTIGNNGSNSSFNIPSLNLKDNQCHHLAVVRQNNSIVMYVDGVLYNPNFTNSSTIQFLFPPLYIGVLYHDSFLDWYFNGLIKEVRLWNSARSQGQIQSFMNFVPSGASNPIGYWRCNEGS